MTTYKVYQHWDTYAEVEVEAESEQEAQEIGEKLLEDMDDDKFLSQIRANLEAGEVWVVAG